MYYLNELHGPTRPSSERPLGREMEVSHLCASLTLHGAMGRQIDPSCGEPIELFLAPRLV